MSAYLAEVVNVSKRFGRPASFASTLARTYLGIKRPISTVHAVDQVTLGIRKGEILGLVGESGSGKSTLGRILAGLSEASEGEVKWMNVPRGKLTANTAKAARLSAQLIFQDPMSALNPRMRVLDAIGEAPLLHGLVGPDNLRAYVESLLTSVGLDPSLADRYPHQFSGGQRQRLCIARALAVKPSFLICDEALSALDVSVQAQMLNLFAELKTGFDLTYLFISHDLNVVRYLTDRVAVMYLGRVVESGRTEDVFSSPRHPYTQALIAELPSLRRRQHPFAAIKGEMPSPMNRPNGCHFHPRCSYAFDRCRKEAPKLHQTVDGRELACHLAVATG